jgi:hypothetical protein
MTRASDLAKLLGAGATILDGTTISTADNTTQLTLTSTDADSSIGPVLDLVRDSASPADGDGIGQIKFIADNDAGEATTYSTAFTTLRDASNGAEDGQTINYVMTGGALVDHLRMGRGSANGQSEVVVNEGSVDIDFRVESNGNANMLFVDGGNNAVGIGTNSPTRKLSIYDATTPYMALYDGSSGTTISDGFQVQFASSNAYLWNYENGFTAFGTNANERMRIDTSGNLLVGATSSNVGAFGAVSPQILVAGTIPQVALHETDTDKDGYIGIASSTMFIQTADAIPIRFGTSDAERMRIDSSGRLLLGTTTEGASGADQLTVSSSSNTGITIRAGTSSSSAVYFSDGTSGTDEYDGYISYSHSTRAMSILSGINYGLTIDGTNRIFKLTDAGTERMRINSSGNVGIGESSPQRALHVNGIAKFMRTVTLGGSTGSNNYIGYFTAEAFANNAGESNVTVGTFSTQPLQFATNSTERMRIDSSGRLGLGITSPDAKLHVISGDADTQIKLQSAGSANATSSLLMMSRRAGAENQNVTIKASGGNLSIIGDTNYGNVTIGKTAVDNSTVGIGLFNDHVSIVRSSNTPMLLNRVTNDGQIVSIRQDNTEEGSIAVSGNTVTYGGFSGLHESSGIATDTPIGTVVSTIDELDVYFAKQGEGDLEEDNPKAGQTRADHAKVKVSDTEGDKAVYGVVGSFNAQGKVNVASVGIGSVRVTGVCEKGDLLESNGDGTAKVQSDDIVRSKTIGKVTIGNSSTDVKLVSCVLYCG